MQERDLRDLNKRYIHKKLYKLCIFLNYFTILLQTREKDESIRGNMKQYNKEHQYLDIIVSDFSMPLWKNSMKFDAIITDRKFPNCFIFKSFFF